MRESLMVAHGSIFHLLAEHGRRVENLSLLTLAQKSGTTSKKSLDTIGQISSATFHDAFKAHDSVTSVSGLAGGGGDCPFNEVISFPHSSYMLIHSLPNDSNDERLPTFLLLK